MDTYIIKSGYISMFVFRMINSDIEIFILQVAYALRAKKFSAQRLIALDLNSLAHDIKIDFSPIQREIKDHRFFIGIIGGSASQKVEAINHGFYVLPEINAMQLRKSNKSIITQNLSEIINITVRSGQKIYAKNRDLICIATINNGAEIISDGNIHVYGKLSGRVLAGASGNKNASIFCTNFNAEIVSIAGIYDAGINLKVPMDTLVQIQLINDKLQVREII